MKHLRFGVVLGAALAIATIVACEAEKSLLTEPPPSASAGGGVGTGGEGGDIFTTSVGGSMMQGFDVQPDTPQTISVSAGQTMPTVDFTALLDGNPIAVGWGVDRGEIGTLDQGPVATTTFTPRGAVGGLVRVLATYDMLVLERQVMVELSASQNGPDPNNPAEQAQIASTVAQLTLGGGIGGVGGEGLGPAVTDPATLAALANPTSNGQAEGLRLIYPYDSTVWPRGLLAPLLQWRWSIGDADAVKIELQTTSGSFTYQGTFGRPAILIQTGGPMVRHPIPQGAWAMGTNSAGGNTLNNMPENLIMRLTIARNGIGYGPITQTWRVAPGRPSGTIYYNSYGTQLAKNYGGAVGGDGTFGGAVLSIKVGDTAPLLAAGSSGGPAQCRVCHSVAADGSRLIAQQFSGASSSYAITPNNIVESVLANSAEFPGITPDGAYALNALGQLLDLNNGGNLVPVSGLSAVSTNIGTPAFSPDGTRVVLNPMAGPGITNPTQKLVVMAFDPMTFTFSAQTIVADFTGSGPETRPGWGAFFPDNASVVFQQQIAAGFDGNGLGDLRTRKGAKGFLAWAPANGSTPPVALDRLNGKDGNVVYLPQLSQPINMSCTGDGFQVGNIDPSHADDVNLNYEPTVNPVASGGYAWVVFTSRRMYGSVADIPPFCSDPRGVNLVTNITPKKLWVAAVDLNAPPNTDGSHPGFYLPAQELLAGNARAFWVLDPCKMDGEECMSGDQCCNGFCSPSGSGPNDPLICSPVVPPCSMPQEKCTTAADCCDGTNLCINGFCALAPPQ